MATFRNRFASIQDIVFVFAACVFLVYSWSIFAFLERMPSWLFHLSTWDVISVFAYTQTFALLESAIVLLVLIFLGATLPARFLRDRFVAQGSMVMLLTSGWAIAVRYNMATVLSWTLTTFFFWAALYLVSIGVFYVLIHRYKRLEEAINSFAERLTVLLYVYIPITCLSVFIVIIRNI